MNKRQAKKYEKLYDLCISTVYYDKISWKDLRRTKKDYTRFCNAFTWWVGKGDVCDTF